jgi:MinD superfamily P-loop ATPase
MTKELVIISGKGGTGKTSAIASFAALETNNDCDVDAADYARAVAEEYAAFCRGGN